MKQLKEKILFILLLMLSVGVESLWGYELGTRTSMDLELTAQGSSGSWDSSSKKLSWTLNYDNICEIPKGSITDLTQYDYICLRTSDLTANTQYRVCIKVGENAYNYGISTTGLIMVPLTSGNWDKTVDANTFKSVSSINVAGWNATENSGSVKITEIFLFKKTHDINWDENGYITIPYYYFPESAWNITRSEKIITKTDDGYSNLVVGITGLTDASSFCVNGSFTKGTIGQTGDDAHNTIENFIVQSDNTNYRGRTLNDWTNISDITGPISSFELQFYMAGVMSLESVVFKHKDSRTVTFDSQGGTACSSMYYFHNAITLPTPTKDNANFDGWYTAAEGGSKIEGTYSPTADVTLYAHWSEAVVNSEQTITVDGNNRKYWLYVPASARNKTNIPVIFSLHGRYNTCDPSNSDMPKLNSYADANGAIIVYPQGRKGTDEGYETGWNAGFTDCTGWEATGFENADTRYLKALVDEIKTKYAMPTGDNGNISVNPNTFYMTGFSMGGMMTYAFANACPGIFAAYAAVDGYPINEFHLQTSNMHKTPFLHIHNSNDQTVIYANVATIADNMIARYGCNPIGESVELKEWDGTTTRANYNKVVYKLGDVSTLEYITCTGNVGHAVNSFGTRDIWAFFDGKKLEDVQTNRLEWEASLPYLTQNVYDPTNHGWVSADSKFTYGKTNGDSNVYHDIPLKAGNHKVVITFSSAWTEGNSTVSLQNLTANKQEFAQTYTNENAGNTVAFTFSTTANGQFQMAVGGQGVITSLAIYEEDATPKFDVTTNRVYHLDFEGMTDASFADESAAPTGEPQAEQKGKYYNYGGRGRILSHPVFGKYYQNLPDADEYTRSIGQNFLRIILTDDEVNELKKTFVSADGSTRKGAGESAISIGFWVNGYVAVKNELPLERGSMFCMFSNLSFGGARSNPRYMFDLACNGGTYGYMPKTEEKEWKNSFSYGGDNSSQSLFNATYYQDPLDQGQSKFYDDNMWHYITYVADTDMKHITLYVDGNKTGEISDITSLSGAKFEEGGDYHGRVEYLRNIVLGGFTPHGLYQGQQCYSDAALAYDDISIYSVALTQDNIKDIIAQKNYNTDQWSGTFAGLDCTGSYEINSNVLTMQSGSTFTVKNVPNGYYIRFKSKYTGSDTTPPVCTGSVEYQGERGSDNEYSISTMKAVQTGEADYTFTVKSPIQFESIRISPYRYAAMNYSAATVSNPAADAFPQLSLKIDGGSYGNANEDLSDYVNNGGRDTYIRYSSSAPHIAYVSNDGSVTTTGIAGNATITAELVSGNVFDGNTTASYEVQVTNNNTSSIASGSTHSVGETITQGNIKATLGGWAYNSGAYSNVTDAWEDGSSLSMGDEEKIDGFSVFTVGKQDAKGESLGYTAINDGDGKYHPETEFEHNKTAWTLPCRGSYLKFEPSKAGVLTVYVMQNGNLAKANLSDEYSSSVNWRPVYIADETGALIQNVETATNGKIGANDNFFANTKRRAQFIESVDATYNEHLMSSLKAMESARRNTLIDNWANAGWKQRIIASGDGGFMVMTKAIVRYTFNVLPGKTYYMFSNNTKIGLSGFNFEEGKLLKENGTATDPLRAVSVSDNITLADNANYSAPAASYDEASVTYSRSFTSGQWSSICLPFSMNSAQMKENFGEDAKVLLLDKIVDNTVYFVYHVNQDIIAGYPYLIKPSKSVTGLSFNACIDKDITAARFAVGEDGSTIFVDSKSGYVFEGGFSGLVLNKYSYAVTKSGALGYLTSDEEAKRTVKPYRAYIQYYGSESGAKALSQMSISGFDEDGATTAIETILFKQGILSESSDVVGIDGKVVRRNSSVISDLPKGVYIVNGKKYVK